MKKVLLTLIVSIAFCGPIFAQAVQGEHYNPNNYTSHWASANLNPFVDVDYPCFFVKINNNIVTFDDRWYDLEFASFVGDECRGHDFMTSEYLEYGWAYPLLEGLMVKFDNPGERVSFKMYDHATGIEYNLGTSNIPVYAGVDHSENWSLLPEDFGQEGWEKKALFILIESITISATAHPAGGGTITGAGVYEEGAVCTLSASAHPGYSFLNWTENDSVVSSDAEYSFTVKGSRNLVANFVANQ